MFASASRIVFLLMGFTVCTAFFIGALESKDFMVLANLVFVFYYTKKTDKVTDKNVI
jgi:hypothetical protein